MSPVSREAEAVADSLTDGERDQDRDSNRMPDSDHSSPDSDDALTGVMTSDHDVTDCNHDDGGGKVRVGDEKKRGRKSNKPRMEKRRRERMNASLNDMKTLVYEAVGKNPAQYSKQEKAAVLEMTVDFLKTVKNRQHAGTVTQDSVQSYHSGYRDCTLAVGSCLKLQGLPRSLVDAVMHHLHTHGDRISHEHAAQLQQLQHHQHQHPHHQQHHHLQQLQHHQFLQHQQGVGGMLALPGPPPSHPQHHPAYPPLPSTLAPFSHADVFPHLHLTPPPWMLATPPHHLTPPPVLASANQAPFSSLVAAPTAFQTPVMAASHSGESGFRPIAPRLSLSPSASADTAAPGGLQDFFSEGESQCDATDYSRDAHPNDAAAAAAAAVGMTSSALSDVSSLCSSRTSSPEVVNAKGDEEGSSRHTQHRDTLHHAEGVQRNTREKHLESRSPRRRCSSEGSVKSLPRGSPTPATTTPTTTTPLNLSSSLPPGRHNNSSSGGGGGGGGETPTPDVCSKEDSGTTRDDDGETARRDVKKNDDAAIVSDSSAAPPSSSRQNVNAGGVSDNAWRPW